MNTEPSRSADAFLQRILRHYRILIPLVLAIILVITAIVTIFVLVIFSFSPTTGAEGEKSVTGLSGPAGKRQLADDWPAAVDPAEVQNINYMSRWSRDHFDTWYQIELSPMAAAQWADSLHAEEQQYAERWAGHKDEDNEFEVYDFSMHDRPRQSSHATPLPEWWEPPVAEYRVTDLMLWYADRDSGTRRGVYTTYDAATGTLWAYVHAAQHDQEGFPPPGTDNMP